MKRIFLLLTLLLSFFLISCDNEEKFKFTQNEISIYVNEEVDIPYKYSKEIEFLSSNDSVEIIGNKLKGKSIGVSIITVNDEKFKDIKLIVTVEPVFKFTSPSFEINVGNIATISYFLLDGYELEITTSNNHITYTNGQVIGVSPGETSLLARVTKGDYIYKVNLFIIVNAPSTLEEIVVEGINNITVGETTRLSYTLIPNTYEKVTWSSSDESVATVNSYGYVTAHKEGIVTITANVGEITATFKIAVHEPVIVLEEIVIYGVGVVNVGDSVELIYELVPDTNETVTWSSSDESIAKVNSYGFVTTYQKGRVTITASVGDISGTHQLIVVDGNDPEYVDLYYINDLHGAIEREGSSLGLAYIANFIDKRREENPNTLLLAGGDILQGQAMSNYYYGKSTLTIMELMGFDAMAVGNHEFDWGLKKVTDNFDPVTGIVSFPLLGINIREKATNELPENILPYVMIEKPDAKVGVIGVIGEYLESSIAYNMVKDYDFISPLDLIKDAASTLRNSGADYVVVVIHDDNDSLNYSLSLLSGKERVDAIFNAHSHWLTAESINGVPVIQSRHNGEYVGHIRLYKYGSFNLENINYHDDLNIPNVRVQQQIEIYKAETDPIFNKVIIKNRDDTTDRNELSSWIARLMRTKTNADIGFQNYGGTRTYISANEDITLKKLYQIWPFDNVIKTVKLKGSYIKILMDNSSLVYDTNLIIEDEVEYLVATNDYVFDYEGNQYIFNQGTEHTNTGILLRDLADEELTRQSEIYDYFDVDNPLTVTYFFNEEYIFAYL